jgi:hypothetical protein
MISGPNSDLESSPSFQGRAIDDDTITLESPYARAGEGPAIRRVNMNEQVTCEIVTNSNADARLRIAQSRRSPAQQTEARRAFLNSDLLSGSEPVLRSLFLHVANVAIAFLVAEQPSQKRSHLGV